MLALLLGPAAQSDDTPLPGSLDGIPFATADLEIGEEINETCAGCHGEYGPGGKEGEDPRLAGLPATFIAEQLLLFRDRTRTNLAMVEYVDHRQMPDDEIAHVAAYLAGIECYHQDTGLDPATALGLTILKTGWRPAENV